MVRLAAFKEQTQNKPIEKLPLAPRVYLPLSQHIGKACSPLMKKADAVARGEKIAAAEAHVYAPIHASLSGKVLDICDWPHPLLGSGKAIVIESDGKDQALDSKPRTAQQVAALSAEEIRQIVEQAGIVGLGGAAFPTHIKLHPPKPVESLIINGAECEPYLTGDYRLMVEKTQEISQGIALAAKCLGAKNIYFAIEEDKLEAIKESIVPSFAKASEGRHSPQSIVKILKPRYPQGGEKQLIRNILKKEVPQGKLPFEIGVVVQNAATIYAIYQAVYLNQPLYERVITVSGDCLAKPKNLLVRLGTPIKSLIDFCGPLTVEPAKIIIGGPMMGIAQTSQEVPVIKSTTGVILLSVSQAKDFAEQCCIRCGACVRECPAGLMPCLINLAAEKNRLAEAIGYQATDCIECGLCDYVCPAKRKLTQSIKRVKEGARA